ncbi:MAG: hypothetical protein AAFX94_05820 [Myxococcota bacterium]
MTRSRLPTNELDAALTVLEEVASQVAESQVPDGETQAPPPLPSGSRRTTKGEYDGRTEFPDLFQADSVAGDPSRMAPVDKVEFFRQKLKHAEGLLSNFKIAWRTRNEELDHVEALLESSRGDRDRAQVRLKQLESFLEDKRSEIDSYAQQVAAAFAEKEESEHALREQLAEELAEQERLRDEADIALRSQEEIAKLRQELGPRVAELETERQDLTGQLDEARGEIALLRKKLSDRDGKLQEVSSEAEETEDRLRRAAAARDEELTAKLLESRERSEALESRVEPLQRERDELLVALEKAQLQLQSANNQLLAKDELVNHYREESQKAGLGAGVREQLGESIHQAGKTLSSILRGGHTGEALTDGLREVLRRLKEARAALDSRSG